MKTVLPTDHKRHRSKYNECYGSRVETLDGRRLFKIPKSDEEIAYKVTSNLTGDIVYYYRGEYHRDDGPAIIRRDGQCSWFYHGKLHRVDGPAIDNSDPPMWAYLGQVYNKPADMPLPLYLGYLAWTKEMIDKRSVLKEIDYDSN